MTVDKQRKFMHCFMLVCLFIIAISMAIIAYLRWFDGVRIRPVIKSNTDLMNLVPEKEQYNIGDKVNVTVDYCKLRNIEGTLYLSLIDGIKADFGEKQVISTLGCHVSTFALGPIPDTVQGKVVHFEGRIEYQVNPLRTVVVPFQTIKFTVKNPDVVKGFDDVLLNSKIIPKEDLNCCSPLSN